MKLIVKIVLFFFLLTNFYSPVYSQILEKNEANKLVDGSKLIRLDKKGKYLKYIQLKENYFYTKTDEVAWLNKALKFSKIYSLKAIRKNTDKKGISHTKYQINYKNIPIEGSVYSVHSINGVIHSANGEYILGKDITVIPSLTEPVAFEKAIKYVNATKYTWQTGNSSRSVGELTIMSIDTVFVLAYKYDIYAIEPLSRQYVFVNANTGEIIKSFNRIHILDTQGTAKTMYNGVVSITTDSYNGSYRLREAGRGNGIETYNLNHGTSQASTTDFTDADNNWTDTTDYNHAANDAHYATEATYDYYFSKFNRNSYDNQGAKIKSYVHYGHNYVNAFWDGSCMTYGDGDGVNYLPLTPIEVVAHEITHGVTEHSAGLIYSGESGALNESFSDIFGVVIDFFKNPSTANYLMGDAMSVTHTPFRSMENPNAYRNPDTYKGLYWDPNQEVHTNSGVQNYWFYLVCEGSSGVNDLGNSFKVIGIGREKAAQIAYRNLTEYLTPSSGYSDARFYSIQSAIDLFGDCSPEVIAVTNAWYAVGVGDSYNNSVVADFVVSKTHACDSNSPIYFSNRSSKANIYRWNFGDGQSDTVINPVHTYKFTGTYSVRLIAQGIAVCNNTDTLTKQNLINVTNGQAPIAAICAPHTLYPGDGGIFQFRLNTINNTTKGSMDDYKDYSCNYQTTVQEGKEYELYVKVGINKPENVNVWIDLNNNGSLDNQGELVFRKNNVTKDFSEKIIIPGGAHYNVPLRLRIGSDYVGYSFANSCSNTNYGQFQDYAISIQQNNSKPLANFVSSSQLMAKGDTIHFNDATLNLPTSWRWSFPGGTPSSSITQNPIIVYNTPGTFEVSLISSNSIGVDTIIKKDYIKVLDQLYCTSMLGGSGNCPGDISLVEIKGTTLNNTNHNICSTLNGSTYGSYAETGNTTAILKADSTYQLSVTTSASDIISIWIDYNQNGVFEATEWAQVATFSLPNQPSKINITIPSTALVGKTGMRIRSRANGNPNGANDACTGFRSGITEDYFVTISNLPRPKNFTAIVKNNTTGEVELKWSYSATLNSTNLVKTNGFSEFTFTKFKIYRNGIVLDSTLKNDYTDLLTAYGDYKYEVKAVYDVGESRSAAPISLGWYGNPQIAVTPLSFNETLLKGDSVTRIMTIRNTGNGLLIFNINKYKRAISSSFNFKVEQLVPQQTSFNSQNYHSDDKTPIIAVMKRITNKNINPKGLENILVFDSFITDSNAPYDNVLNKLGFSRTVVNNWNDLNNQLTNGTKWNLVIVNSYRNAPDSNVLDQLEIYRSRGGKLIYADWNVFNYSSHALLIGLGVKWISDLYTPLNVIAVDSISSLFTSPNHLTRINWSLNQANIDGQITEVLQDATQIGQFEGASGSGAIVIKKSGNSIFNAFQAINFNKDDNGNGISDVEELIENEITYLNGNLSQKWISVSQISDTLSIGQSTNVSVKFNSKDLKSGLYNDTINIECTSLITPKVKVPCKLNVLGKPSGEFKGDKTKVLVGSNVQFSDLSTGNPTIWKWLLPGGTPATSILKDPITTYSNLGSYDVTLIVTNEYGVDTITKKSYIMVAPKVVANFYGIPTNIITGSYVYFYDSSVNNPTSWKWIFSGGTPSYSMNNSASVVYNTPGTYDVKLVVSNALGSDSIIKTGYITVSPTPKPVANFNSSSTSTRTGSYVYFYDNSTNYPTSWKWIFSGGTPSYSMNSSASVVYNNPGTYDVKLVVTNAGGSDSIVKTDYITVSPTPKPVANFYSNPTSTTTGSYIYFYDNSANYPTSWKWTFSGGTPLSSTYNNPYVVYNTPGKYDVKLVVSNSGGSDSIVKTGYIIITPTPKPIANFYASPTVVKVGSYVSFNDNSSNYPTSRKWIFSGGTPSISNSAYPYVMYNNPGIFDVKMVVSNSGGSDSIVKAGFITVLPVQKPIANFNSDVIKVITGNYVYFSDNSANSPSSWQWTFTGGNPSTSTYSNPSVTYSSPGIYSVKMVVANNAGTDTIVKTAYITVTLPPKPVANFSTGGTTILTGNAVYFTDISSNNPTSRKWVFAGGTPSTSTYNNLNVTYNLPGTYDVKLLVSNAGGSDSINRTSLINVVSSLPGDSCSTAQDLSKLSSPYSSSTTGYKSNFSFCSFSYSPDRIFYIDVPNGNTLSIGQTFNDFDSRHSIRIGGSCPGNTELVCVDDPDIQTHTYTNNAGSLQRVFFILGGFGSSYGNFTLVWRVSAPGIPVADFTVDQNNVQIGSHINFSDQSSGIPTSWKWYFQGGSPISSTSNNPFVFYSVPGKYKVKLIASNTYGSDSIVKTDYITVAYPPKPIANFYTSSTIINTGSSLNFYDTSSGYPNSWKWSFEGGNPSTSTNNNASVVYNTPGLYTVKLVVSNLGGSDSIVKTKYITVISQPKPVANFNGDKAIVAIGNYVYFNDNSGNNPTSWKWTFYGGYPSTSTYNSASVQYYNPGRYDVKLVVSNAGGSDSITKTGYITVTLPPKPVADFSASSTSILIGSNVYFSDISTNSPTSRKWTFVGGSPSTSTYSNQSVTYSLPGAYNVKLVVSNAGGSDSITKIGYIIVSAPPKPKARFYSNIMNTTPGNEIHFEDRSMDNPTSWKWIFPGGFPSSSTQPSPTVRYDNFGAYDVKLVVTNVGGSDSVICSGYIKVSDFAYCTSNLGGNGCPGDIKLVAIKGTSLKDTIHNSCGVYNSSTYACYPANGSTTASLVTGKTYELSVSASNNDIISVWIDYNQNRTFEPSEWNQVAYSTIPYAVSKVNITIPKTALEGRTAMRIRSRASGNNNGATDACSNFGSGITEDYLVTINKEMDFSADVTKVCVNQAVKFTDLSFGSVYSWDFGSGATPKTANTAGPHSVVFTTPGVKTISLVVDGTEVTKSNYVNVTKYPNPFNLLAPLSYCKGNLTSITIEGSEIGTTYQLYRNGSSINPLQPGTIAKLIWANISSGKYYITATPVDNYKCAINGRDTLVIIENASYNSQNTISICLGENYTLPDGKKVSYEGEYTSTFSTKAGCDSSVITKLSVKSLPITPTIQLSQNSLLSDFIEGNQWYSIENGLISGAISHNYQPLSNGNYYSIVSSNGCNSLSSNKINVTLTGLDGTIIHNTITIFPNPISDFLNIRSDNEIIINSIEIRNELGSLVQKVIPENRRGKQFVVDMSMHRVGYYTVLLYTDKGLIPYKITKTY